MKKWNDILATGQTLTTSEVVGVADDLLSADFSDEEKADFLGKLHQRGETADEIAAFAEAFLEHAHHFSLEASLRPVLDVCGTGGDKLGLFNVSTAVMFVAAGAGARVVKHGNRGITSKCGGADVLEALGVKVELPQPALQDMLAEAGAAFLFAPVFHPTFKAVAGARKILAARGQASIFNMLGPLLNPARPEFQLTGVFHRQLLELYATALPKLGRRSAWIVHGQAGHHGVMDEISTLGPTACLQVRDEFAERHEFDVRSLGIAAGSLDALRGGDAADNAVILETILSGAAHGPRRDIVIVNAAAALQVTGLASDWSSAIAKAEESLDSGKARQVLQTMRKISASA